MEIDMNTLDEYLRRHELTRYKLAQTSGISATTWVAVNDKPLNRWTVKQVQAIADASERTAPDTLKELQEIDKNG